MKLVDVYLAAVWGLLFALAVELAKFTWHRLVTRVVHLQVLDVNRKPVRGVNIIANDRIVVLASEKGKATIRVPRAEALKARVYDGDEPMYIENSSQGRWVLVRSFAVSETDIELIVARMVGSHPRLDN